MCVYQISTSLLNVWSKDTSACTRIQLPFSCINLLNHAAIGTISEVQVIPCMLMKLLMICSCWSNPWAKGDVLVR